MIKCNCLIIVLRKNYCLVAWWRAHSWVNISFDRIFVPSMDYVPVIWTLDIGMWPWRVVRSLLHVYISTINTLSLICFSKHRVQRLLKGMVSPEECNRTSYDSIHSFNRVRLVRSIIEIEGIYALYSRYGLKQWFGRHTLYWETDCCQIEISTQDFFANCLEHLSSSASQSALKISIFKLKPSIVCGIIPFVLISWFIPFKLFCKIIYFIRCHMKLLYLLLYNVAIAYYFFFFFAILLQIFTIFILVILNLLFVRHLCNFG